MLRVFNGLNGEQAAHFKHEHDQRAQCKANRETSGSQHEAFRRNGFLRQVRRVNNLYAAALLFLGGVCSDHNLLLFPKQVVVTRFLCLILAIQCFQSDFRIWNRVDARIESSNLFVSFVEHLLLSLNVTVHHRNLRL